MNGDFVMLQRRDVHAQLAQQFHRRANIAQIRHIAQLHGISSQQRRTHDRQRRIFCTAHADVAVQTQLSCSAGDFELFHV